VYFCANLVMLYAVFNHMLHNVLLIVYSLAFLFVFVVCRLTRGNQLFMFPIHLSEYLSPSATFYGTVVPLAAYFAINTLIVKPFLNKQQERYIT